MLGSTQYQMRVQLKSFRVACSLGRSRTRRVWSDSMHQPVSVPTSRRANGKARTASSELNLSKLLQALQSVRDGDFSVRLASDQIGLAGKVADTFNEIVSANQRLAGELERVGQIVGKDGKTRHRMSSERRSGAWGAMEQSVNTLIDDLLRPSPEETRHSSAVAKGDLQQAMSLEVDGRALKGEFLRSATIVNTMIAQMSAFTSEVTRVAR